MIRILHIFVSLPVGGAENLLLSTIRGLDSNKFVSVVCCISEKGQVGEEIEALGVPVYALEKLKTGGIDRTIINDIQKLIQDQSINLVHTHLYHANFYGRLAAKKSSIPVVSSIHNTYSGKPKLHRRLINWYLARYTKIIIAGSQEIRNDIVNWDNVPVEKIELIPNTVDLNASNSRLTPKQARGRFKLSSKITVLGALGRLEEQKGHYFLLEAVALLKARNIHTALLLVGDGRLRANLEKQAHDLNIIDDVYFLGTRRDIGDLFKAMDIFIMPSLWEGLSLAMLSAMAAKLPVIATRVGGVKEVIGDDCYGLTVPSRDSLALSKAIKRLINNPEEAKNFAKLGQEKIKENYSDSALIATLEKIYMSAMN